MEVYMPLSNVCNKLDQELRKESLCLHKDENEYAVPAKTSCDTYDEIFREYEIFDGKIFTVMIRKNKLDGKYWVRCGYKETPDSNYVGGIEGRDCATYDIAELIDHCRNHFNVVLNHKGWRKLIRGVPINKLIQEEF
jgi:hypothetical protein